MTGQGLVTEAVQAVLNVASGLSKVSRVEIRCDVRNLPSAAVPRRLGFALESSVPAANAEATSALQVWVTEFSNP